MSEATLSVRQPAVAGSFYPGRRDQLQAQVSRLLAEAAEGAEGGETPAV